MAKIFQIHFTCHLYLTGISFAKFYRAEMSKSKLDNYIINFSRSRKAVQFLVQRYCHTNRLRSPSIPDSDCSEPENFSGHSTVKEAFLLGH